MPGDSHAPGAQSGNADAQVSRRICLEEWLLANDGGFGDFGIRRRRPLTWRRMRNANEDHVPVGATPTSPFGVPGKELLLWTRIHLAIDQGVGHPSTAGPAVVLMKHNIAADMHAPKRYSLRDCPLHTAASGRDGKAFRRSPEGGSGIVVGFAGIRMDVADNVHGVRRGS